MRSDALEGSMPPHDNAYKNLFTHPQVVQDLLRGFVHEDWVREIDFSTLEKASGSYVSDDLRDREDDIIWRVRRRDTWFYIYLLIEFQSTDDPWMALRVMTYVGLLYQDLIKRREVVRPHRLPPVFPAVIYNGSTPWRSHRDMVELIEPPPAGLQRYLPRHRYFLLDEGREDAWRRITPSAISLRWRPAPARRRWPPWSPGSPNGCRPRRTGNCGGPSRSGSTAWSCSDWSPAPPSRRSTN
jgi:hypothetical protein